MDEHLIWSGKYRPSFWEYEKDLIRYESIWFTNSKHTDSWGFISFTKKW